MLFFVIMPALGWMAVCVHMWLDGSGCSTSSVPTAPIRYNERRCVRGQDTVEVHRTQPAL
jgi:hypothetical protein